MERRQFLRGTGAAIGGSLVAGCVGGGSGSGTVTVDYAYYNPVSLVLREKGWLEAAFADTGTDVEWVLSLGSNQANEYAQSGEADVSSTAGIAALMARTNGVPITTPYVYSEPEWTALVTFQETGIESVADLEGKRVAATRGTDPYFFLLQALGDAGLSEDDVEVVNLQHPEGQSALVRGDVDAWAGLDPHMAELELEHYGAELFFREPRYNTYGFLNFLDGFLADRTEQARRVLEAYERGRRWAIENPEATAGILADASEMSAPVAERVFTRRTDLSEPIPGEPHRELLADLSPVLEREGLVTDDADPAGAVDELIDSEFATEVV
ncbi:aliphatic sulfonate ABC transporter substrate-binding protein [Halorubrum sp. Atlit-8R]|uniref:aliphatic sulfonate ABC transporter substrate-binding protein n=1 Tax=unclassified Halorubrum TaxID=2642239 RepID=UPI000EF23198|nr:MULTISPECIES: aliphatic sulfonate ABC transporter substrate-binding protein [unclassified Halorubrum]RLM70880.1 aliphatic sulfonate ABC transporter substrate-binding protein [Halorubrum sp. Atlit-9R]RLM71748.1 aliphatic sulfonate ABC transporter substrate-binding protein [Halorubrum sp. Atlit-9R]RLM82967.1 aliphatic sulfonate ABC transporter substrate-binding protein [Halorubrum sp. Atlit-8R]